MNYNKLGNTDLNVSTICLGTMTWGEQNSQEEGFEQMDYALEKGINFFDTAELYAVPPKKETYGKTEEIIGNWFNVKKNREKIILATKIAGNGLSWIRNGGFQYDKKNITEAIEKSLVRLKTDYIDLYQLHWPERKANYFGKLGYQHQDKEERETHATDTFGPNMRRNHKWFVPNLVHQCVHAHFGLFYYCNLNIFLMSCVLLMRYC